MKSVFNATSKSVAGCMINAGLVIGPLEPLANSSQGKGNTQHPGPLVLHNELRPTTMRANFLGGQALPAPDNRRAWEVTGDHSDCRDSNQPMVEFTSELRLRPEVSCSLSLGLPTKEVSTKRTISSVNGARMPTSAFRPNALTSAIVLL
jgi:hypothetical protein